MPGSVGVDNSVVTHVWHLLLDTCDVQRDSPPGSHLVHNEAGNTGRQNSGVSAQLNGILFSPSEGTADQLSRPNFCRSDRVHRKDLAHNGQSSGR